MFHPLFGFTDHRTPEQKKADAERRRLKMEEALKNAQPWSGKWEPLAVIKADTFPKFSLFDVKPWPLYQRRRMPNNAEHTYFESDEHDLYRYVETTVARGRCLQTAMSAGIGFACFDAEVTVPALYSRRMNGGDEWNWAKGRNGQPDPWMSFTPMELYSLKPGTSLAKGHTVVAGLGLGWQLIQVLKRDKVEAVTLVEDDGVLVEWLLPRIKLHVSAEDWKKLVVLVGDAHEVVPKLKADVALIDIYPSYGGNEFLPNCNHIKKVWCWGSGFPKGAPSSLWSPRKEAPW